MNFLSDEEREQLKQKHRKERDGRVRDRIKSVILSDQGWTPKKIAEALLISEDAVRNHIQEYKNRYIKTYTLKIEKSHRWHTD